MKYKIWNGLDTLITPIGEQLSPQEVSSKYPIFGVPGMKVVIVDSPINLKFYCEFEHMKEQYKLAGASITDNMTDQEVLDAITYFEENPPAPEPSAEERMAAALEFQSMMMMPV